jgi:aryl-alcohol dehydrogenase-like predicted oxidoreductase
MGVIAWSPLNGGSLGGRHRRDQPPVDHGRAARIPHRFDRSRAEVQRKLDAVEELTSIAEDAGLTLPHLALAFVLAHPAVTSAIIGPRTMEQLDGLLGAAEVNLESEVLDRIDAVVPPGVTLDPDDLGWTPPALTDPSLRRRRSAEAR